MMLPYEVRLSPRAPGSTILRPAFPVRAGEEPTNRIRFEEGKLMVQQHGSMQSFV